MAPFIADFHIHSRYSRATSPELDLEHLDYWARLKGIKVVGTGDFTHPAWWREITTKLEQTEPGLFRLKREYRLSTNLPALDAPDRDPRFILTVELSNIYKKGDRVRKIHHVIFAPDMATVERMQTDLRRLGFNIESDGRPILGMDSRDLLELCLRASPDIFFVPAHIWTPWFAVLGSKSGFDSVTDCFGDLADHIHAVETGLSSDVPMNSLCRFLDCYTLISNSDAHSPEKLGRNANRFACDLSYPAIITAMKTGDPTQFLGTIDFFPQEGKYHYDGHRPCKVCLDPVETRRHNGLCPACGKPVTVGVMSRVVELAERADWRERSRRQDFAEIITLKELLGEILSVGPGSKKVGDAYDNILKKSGAELDILLDQPPDALDNEVLAEGIRRMRAGEVYIQEGYDGEYGRITVFADNEAKSFKRSDGLFADLTQPKRPPKRPLINFDVAEYRRLGQRHEIPSFQKDGISAPEKNDCSRRTIMSELNADQLVAVQHHTGPALVIAGPGTGKTKVLTERIAWLIREKNVPPEQILAVTFTNKAAEELVARVSRLAASTQESRATICTFHALGYAILQEQADKLGRTTDFTIIDGDDRAWILRHRLGIMKSKVSYLAAYIEQRKAKPAREEVFDEEATADDDWVTVMTFEDTNYPIYEQYEAYLRANNLFDLDDLIYQPVMMLARQDDVAAYYRQRFRWILVDEYQDVNYVQFLLIGLLAGTDEPNLFAIGDPNQAIYGFRGADIAFINDFDKVFSPAVTYRLRQSYRCADVILKASSDVLQPLRQAQDRPERLLAGVPSEVKIALSEHPTDKSEAEFIARTIEQLMGGLRFFSLDSGVTGGHEGAQVGSLGEIVVLCRTRAQFDALEKAFHDHTIPYQTVGDTPFFREEPFSLILDTLKLALNPDNAFLRERLLDAGIDPKGFALQPLGSGVKEALSAIINAHFPHLKESHAPDINHLLDLAAPYGDDVKALLRFTDLGVGVDTWQPHIENVTLMTLHASKGLEFEAVFIAGCEDKLLPYALYKQKMDVDEERRLLYVGMTRAKKFLYLSNAQKRVLRGREWELPRSPFLERIERELIEEQRSEYSRKEKPQERQISLF